MEVQEIAKPLSEYSETYEYEPGHFKTYYKTCATSEDSDQTAHSRRLIRVFAGRIGILKPPDYPKSDEQEPCHTGWYRLI